MEFATTEEAHDHLVEMAQDGLSHTIIGWIDDSGEFQLGGFPAEAVPEGPPPDAGATPGEGGEGGGPSPAEPEDRPDQDSMGVLRRDRKKSSARNARPAGTPNPAPTTRAPNNTIVTLTGWNIVLPASAWGLFGFDQALPLVDEEGKPYPWTPKGFSDWLWDVVRDWHERMMPAMLERMYPDLDRRAATQAARRLLDRFLAMDEAAVREIDQAMRRAKGA